MTRIYMVRHGRAAAAFSEDLDPGLDETGRGQAERAAGALIEHAPAKLLSSPLKRAHETATALAERMEKSIGIEPRVAEIPSPGLKVEERGPWLRQIMGDRWSNLSVELQDWRSELIECLKGIEEDTAIFSHFIAINAAVGYVKGDDRVIHFRPDNGSITILANEEKELTLVELGAEANTSVG